MADISWAEERDFCIHCGEADFQEGFGPRTYVICTCCDGPGAHVECEEWGAGRIFTKEQIDGGADWFCCEGCEKVFSRLKALRGKRHRLHADSEEYTLEIVKYTKECKASQQTAEAALKIFRGSFDPLEMSDGRELLEMVCTSYVTPDEEPAGQDEEAFDFSGFNVVVLRKGPAMVTAATLRVFGTRFAELPFVATRKGYRREGNCKRLMQGLEELLVEMSVQYLVMPSVLQVVQMWTKKFKFVPMKQKEIEMLEARIVTPDPDSAVLLKKQLIKSKASHKVASTTNAKRKVTGTPCSTIGPPAKLNSNKTKALNENALHASQPRQVLPHHDVSNKENDSAAIPAANGKTKKNRTDPPNVPSKAMSVVRAALGDISNTSQAANTTTANQAEDQPEPELAANETAAIHCPDKGSNTAPDDAPLPADQPPPHIQQQPPSKAKPPRKAAPRKPRPNNDARNQRQQPAGQGGRTAIQLLPSLANVLAGAISKYTTSTQLQLKHLVKAQQRHITRLQDQIAALQLTASQAQPESRTVPMHASVCRNMQRLRRRQNKLRAKLRNAKARFMHCNATAPPTVCPGKDVVSCSPQARMQDDDSSNPQNRRGGGSNEEKETGPGGVSILRQQLCQATNKLHQWHHAHGKEVHQDLRQHTQDDAQHLTLPPHQPEANTMILLVQRAQEGAVKQGKPMQAVNRELATHNQQESCQPHRPDDNTHATTHSKQPLRNHTCNEPTQFPSHSSDFVIFGEMNMPPGIEQQRQTAQVVGECGAAGGVGDGKMGSSPDQGNAMVAGVGVHNEGTLSGAGAVEGQATVHLRNKGIQPENNCQTLGPNHGRHFDSSEIVAHSQTAGLSAVQKGKFLDEVLQYNAALESEVHKLQDLVQQLHRERHHLEQQLHVSCDQLSAMQQMMSSVMGQQVDMEIEVTHTQQYGEVEYAVMNTTHDMTGGQGVQQLFLEDKGQGEGLVQEGGSTASLQPLGNHSSHTPQREEAPSEQLCSASQAASDIRVQYPLGNKLKVPSSPLPPTHPNPAACMMMQSPQQCAAPDNDGDDDELTRHLDDTLQHTIEVLLFEDDYPADKGDDVQATPCAASRSRSLTLGGEGEQAGSPIWGVVLTESQPQHNTHEEGKQGCKQAEMGRKGVLPFPPASNDEQLPQGVVAALPTPTAVSQGSPTSSDDEVHYSDAGGTAAEETKAALQQVEHIAAWLPEMEE